jgi:hypothetical protein
MMSGFFIRFQYSLYFVSVRDLCYVSLTVYTSISRNKYAHQNIHGRGLNSRSPSSDTKMKDSIYQSNYKT